MIRLLLQYFKLFNLSKPPHHCRLSRETLDSAGKLRSGCKRVYRLVLRRVLNSRSTTLTTNRCQTGNRCSKVHRMRSRRESPTNVRQKSYLDEERELGENSNHVCHGINITFECVLLPMRIFDHLERQEVVERAEGYRRVATGNLLGILNANHGGCDQMLI